MEKTTGIDFLTAAEDELRDAIAWDNEQSEGLGFDFASEVLRTLDRIIRYPQAWAPLSSRTRRCRTNRFPYGVIYQIRKDWILIVSIMHMKREPNSRRSYLPHDKH
jgi:hypothetical protein